MGNFLKFLGALVVIAILLVAGAIWYVFSEGFQTTQVRNLLKQEFGENADIEGVRIGLSQIHIKGLSVEDKDGFVGVERVDLAYSLSALLLKEELRITDFVVAGFELDLSKIDFAAVSSASADGEVSIGDRSVGGGDGADPIPFEGIFTHADQAIPIWLDGVNVDGKVLLPEDKTVLIAMGGGGIAPGKEGSISLDVTIEDPAPDAQFGKGTLRGSFGIKQASPRGLQGISLAAGAEVSGGKITGTPRIDLEISLNQEGEKEVQIINITSSSTAGRTDTILQSRSEFTYADRKFIGGFEVNANQSHIEPFALGKPLPSFTVIGESRYTLDLKTSSNQSTLTLEGTVSDLQKLDTKLQDLGLINWQVMADLSGNQEQVDIARLSASIIREGNQPLLKVETPNNISITGLSGEKPEVVGLDGRPVSLELRELPVGWLAPFVPDMELSGDTLSAALKLVQQGDKLVLTSSEPMRVSGVSLAQGEQAMLEALDASAVLVGSFSDGKVQLTADPLLLSQRGVQIAQAKAEVQLPANNPEELQAVLDVQADLPLLFRQPVLQPYNNLAQGKLSTPTPLTLKTGKHGITLSGIAVAHNVRPKGNTQREIFMAKAELENAAVGYDGSLTLDPLKLDIRSTDLNGGNPQASANPIGRLSLSPTDNNGWKFDANLASSIIDLDDLQLLADCFHPPPVATSKQQQGAPSSSAPASPDAAPFWSGFEGSAKVAVSNFQGMGVKANNVELAARSLSNRLEISNASLSIGDGKIKSSGQLDFSQQENAQLPYTLALDLLAPNIPLDALPVDQSQAFWKSGTLSLDGKASAKGANIDDLIAKAVPQLNLEVKNTTINLSKAMGDKGSLVQAAKIGSGLGGLLASRLSEDGSNPASQYLTSANYIVSSLETFQINEMSLQFNRKDDGNYQIQNLALNTPDFLFTGAGTINTVKDLSFMDLPLDISMALNANPNTKMGVALQQLDLLKAESVGETAYNIGPEVKLSGSLNQIKTNVIQTLTQSLTTKIKQSLTNSLGGSSTSQSSEPSATAELLNTIGSVINQEPTPAAPTEETDATPKTDTEQREEQILNTARGFLNIIREQRSQPAQPSEQAPAQ